MARSGELRDGKSLVGVYRAAEHVAPALPSHNAQRLSIELTAALLHSGTSSHFHALPRAA